MLVYRRVDFFHVCLCLAKRDSLSVSLAKKSSEKNVHHPVLKPDENHHWSIAIGWAWTNKGIFKFKVFQTGFVHGFCRSVDCKRHPAVVVVRWKQDTDFSDVLQIYFTVEGLPHAVWRIIVLDLGTSSITCQQIISGSSHGLIFRAIRHVDHSRHRIPARDVMTPPWRKARAIGEGWFKTPPGMPVNLFKWIFKLVV